MATFRRGYTFGTHEIPTAQKLNDLVDKAVLSGVGQADLAATLDFVNPSQAGSPSTNDNGIDSDGHLTFYDGSRWRKTSGVAYLANNTGGSIPAYSPVVVDPAYGLSVMMTDVADGVGDIRVIGVTPAAIPDGSIGAVVTHGFVQVRVEPNATTTITVPGGLVAAGNSQGSANPDAGIVVTKGQITANTIGYHTAAFAYLLEQVDADATLTEVVKWCMVFK